MSPDEELAEIEWAAGLIPMPAHLIKAGTRVLRYTHRVVLDGPVVAHVVTEEPSHPTNVIPHHIEALPRPIVEMWVWGELVSRTIEPVLAPYDVKFVPR